MKLIYTGYVWRPLKEAEVELNEDKTVYVTEPKEPQAGDIMEGESICWNMWN